MLRAILLILLLIVLIGAFPVWPYAAGIGWGYWPSGIAGVLLAILIVMLVMGRL